MPGKDVEMAPLDHRHLAVTRDHAAILIRDGAAIVSAGSPESAEALCWQLDEGAVYEVRRLGEIAKDWRGISDV
jgi:hypothetical protein